MATRRRTSATKTAKTASTPIKKSTSRASVKKVTTTAPKRVNKVTQTKVSKVTEVTSTPQIEVKLPEGTNLKARPMNKATASKDSFNFSQLTQLRGIDFVILPLIYLEAYVVNFLQNLDVKVPERVAIK